MVNSFHLDGVEAFNKHEYQTAILLFLQAIHENPQSESYLFLGKAYFFCDEKVIAIDYLNTYCKLIESNLEEDANLVYAYDLLGQCYESINKYREAIEFYTSATKKNPLAASAWHNLGLLYIKLAQDDLEKDLKHSYELFHKAQVALKNALDICSINPMFLNSVASWYEKYIEALEKLAEEEEAVQIEIDSNFQLAVQYYQKALTTCQEDDIALKDIIILNLTECLAQYGHHLYRAKKFEEALDLYNQANQFDPYHLVVINQIGMCFFKKNNFAEARKYFLQILEKTADSQELADAWLNIACAYRLEKSWADAQNALTEAKKFAPEDPSIDDEEQELQKSIIMISEQEINSANESTRTMSL